MDLESSRLFIKPIRIEDAQMLIKNPMAFYFQNSIPYEISWPTYQLKADLPLYAERLSENSEELGFGPWYVIDKHKGGYLIGNAGFTDKPDSEGTVEIEFEILEKYHGSGYASEVIEALCNWAFRKKVKKVQATCDKENLTSQKLLIQSGFERVSKDRDFLLFERKKIQARNYKRPILE